MPSPLSNLRSELAAVAAVSIGVLLGTGYAISVARLYNLGVPPSPILAALPQGYYVGEALRALLLPVILAITVGGIWLLTLGQGSLSRKSSKESLPIPSWLVLGLAVVVCSWGFDAFVRHGGVNGANRGYGIALLGITAALAFGAMVLGRFGRRRMGKLKSRTDRRTLALSLIFLVAVVGASAVRICDAAFLADPLPAALVSAEPTNCTLLHSTPEPHHCFFRGFYFGESDQWLFLVQDPPEDVPEYAALHDRLVLIPRDDIEQVILSQSRSSLPRPPAGSAPIYGIQNPK